MEDKQIKCPYAKNCGSCQYQGMAYEQQLKKKQQLTETHLKPFGHVRPILGMEAPLYYRNKVHAVFGRDKKGNVLSGTYKAGTHQIVPISECLIEDQECQAIIHAIRDMLRSFRIWVYDEDRGTGLLRHVLVRKGFATGEIMVVLVVTSPIFPSKNNFVKALLKQFPKITTVVLNINDKDTSMVLGERNITIYGKGFISDTLCGCRFRISPGSFYQVNPVQTEVLYSEAIKAAALTGNETVLDAYCGIGTIGIAASSAAKEVVGIELNPDAVHDAIRNAKENAVKNIRFYIGDAGERMEELAGEGRTFDAVFLDPPRSGCSKAFLTHLIRQNPPKIVYISCNPETQARDLKDLTRAGYAVLSIQPVDMFPFTGHIETVCLLTHS